MLFFLLLPKKEFRLVNMTLWRPQNQLLASRESTYQGQTMFQTIHAGNRLGIERTSNLSVTCVRFLSSGSTSQNFLLEVNLKIFHWIFNEKSTK